MLVTFEKEFIGGTTRRGKLDLLATSNIDDLIEFKHFIDQ